MGIPPLLRQNGATMPMITFVPRAALAIMVAGVAMPAVAQEQPAEAAAPEATAPAAATPGGAADLAKQLSNPIANLISVPFQLNVDRGFGPDGEGIKTTLNIQPVIPVTLNKDWNLIVRTIMPVILQDDLAPGLGQQFGLGDVTQSFFVSPKKPTAGGIVWGIGPVFLYPTGTDPLLGGQKWGAGPTIVVLKQSKGWTIGVLANHIWSIAGKDDRLDISATYMQPFISFTWPTSVSVGLSTESTYNWTAKAWTVPIVGSVSRVIRVGKQPISVQAGARYYVESPVGGPKWGLRSTITLLFPKH